jgi:DGQHR domain-containing protein
MSTKKPKSLKRGKATLSAEEKAKRAHIRRVRNCFVGAGFERIPDLADKAFKFGTVSSDFDDVFVFENLIVLAEYTSKKSSVGDHLKSKKIVYDSVLAKPTDFASLLCDLSTKFRESIKGFHPSKLVVKVIYASLFDFDTVHRTNVPGPIYMDYPSVRYFESISAAVKKSCLPEVLNFLQVDESKVAKNGSFQSGFHQVTYRAQILPEAHSNFDEGFKIVSFYADPRGLLDRAYVMRKNGWRDSANLYQRMVSKVKIASIRKYLHQQKRVFINNIVVTLPSDTRIVNATGSHVDPKKITDTEVVNIQLPARRESIGIVDGQHRVFAYHETPDDDSEIATLRGQQNLLVTGLIYPEHFSDREKEKFEAKLFLEINSNQTSAKDDLKNSILMYLEPFLPTSIATRVLDRLSTSGPLAGAIERYFFEDGLIKTTSIVKYGLVPLIRLDGDQSLVRHWQDDAKDRVVAKSDEEGLDRYIEYCADQIIAFLSAARSNVQGSRWTSDRSVSGFMLSTTSINTMLACLRIVAREGVPVSYDVYKRRLAQIGNFPFSNYKSSQYVRAGEEMYSRYFSSPSPTAGGKAAESA